MHSIRKSKTSYISRVNTRLVKLTKHLYQTVNIRQIRNRSIVFIVGCQRSGTTLIHDIFEADFDAKVYGEFSELSSEDSQKIRLNPLDSVKRHIARNSVPLIILKPLVESQHLLLLLDSFESSYGLWMYRHYKDVASSNLNFFGHSNGIDDLRPIVENQPHNWRSENVSPETREIICRYFNETMNPYDAAALFWLARNRLFFELHLENHSHVTMCKYEHLVQHPEQVMKKIYQKFGQHYPGKRIVSKVHSKSLGKGKQIYLSPEVEQLCEQLYQELDRIYYSNDLAFGLPKIDH